MSPKAATFGFLPLQILSLLELHIKWNHTVCTLPAVPFFTQQMCFRLIRVVVAISHVSLVIAD